MIYNDLRLEPHEYIGLTLGVKKAKVETLLKPMYGQSSILIRDNDIKNFSTTFCKRFETVSTKPSFPRGSCWS